ncbi:MAG TPA: hypothetical protein VN712_08300, partial [Dermatophilaceae bacterium]|nr:hypothetical protein [Dermatophilaceae bacterium]
LNSDTNRADTKSPDTKSPGTKNSETRAFGYRLLGRETGQVVRGLPGAAVATDPLLAAAVKAAVSDGDVMSVNAVHDALADLGVGFVAFRGAATEPLVRHLDATAGMARLGDSHGQILWRVLPRQNMVSPSRLRIVDPQGAPVQPIAVTGDHGRTDVRVAAAPPGARTLGRRLVVAEPTQWADHARVTFGGHELAPVSGGAQPAYDLPVTAGQLTITVAPTHQWWRWGQLGLVVLVLFLASSFGSAPSRRTA